MYIFYGLLSNIIKSPLVSLALILHVVCRDELKSLRLEIFSAFVTHLTPAPNRRPQGIMGILRPENVKFLINSTRPICPRVNYEGGHFLFLDHRRLQVNYTASRYLIYTKKKSECVWNIPDSTF